MLNEIESPGALVGDGELVIHTRQVQLLYHGRPKKEGKNGIVSLPQYSRFCQRLVSHSHKGDLYAEWYLSRLNELIFLFKRYLRDQQGLLIDRVKHPLLTINTWVSRSPVKMSFNGIQNEYGFVGIYLLIEIDLLVRQAVTAKKSCNMNYEEFKTLINTVSKKSRQLFHLPSSFHAMGIDRALFRENPDDERIKQAIKLMGPLPAGSMDLEINGTQGTVDEVSSRVMNSRRKKRARQNQREKSN